MENLYVDFNLINQKVQFNVVSRSKQNYPVKVDFAPPIGDNDGLTGIEALIISFCGCVSTAVVALLRRGGKNIITYEGTATGIRRENPLSLEKIIFEVRVKSDNTTTEDMDKILAIAANIAPVWMAIKNNVEVECEYKILN